MQDLRYVIMMKTMFWGQTRYALWLLWFVQKSSLWKSRRTSGVQSILRLHANTLCSHAVDQLNIDITTSTTLNKKWERLVRTIHHVLLHVSASVSAHSNYVSSSSLSSGCLKSSTSTFNVDIVSLHFTFHKVGSQSLSFDSFFTSGSNRDTLNTKLAA